MITHSTQQEVQIYWMIEAAHELRTLMGYPVDSCYACDHQHHKDQYREAFNRYTVASNDYDKAGITETLTLCALILCSYKADAGPAMHGELDFNLLKELFTAAYLHDIDLVHTYTALIESEKTKLIPHDKMAETRLSYAMMNIETDFINLANTQQFKCFNKATGDTLPGINYTEPDWENAEQWSRVRIQAA